MLWIILSPVLRNPILAGVLVLVIGFVTDCVAIGVLPDPFRFISRWRRKSRLQRTLLQNRNDRRARFELGEIFVGEKKYQLAVDTLKPNLEAGDRKSTRLNSSHLVISYAVFCLKKNNTT